MKKNNKEIEKKEKKDLDNEKIKEATKKLYNIYQKEVRKSARNINLDFWLMLEFLNKSLNLNFLVNVDKYHKTWFKFLSKYFQFIECWLDWFSLYNELEKFFGKYFFYSLDFNLSDEAIANLIELDGINDNRYDFIKNFIKGIGKKYKFQGFLDYGYKNAPKSLIETLRIVYTYLTLNPEKLKDFLELYPKVLEDNWNKVDEFFRKKMALILGASNDVVFFKDNTALYLIENDFGKNSTEVEILKKISKDAVGRIGTFYLNQKNKYNLSKKEAFFRAMFMEYWASNPDNKNFEIKDKDILTNNRKILDKQINDYVKNLNYPVFLKRFYLEFLKDKIWSKYFFDIPLYTKTLQKLNFIDKDGKLNENFLNSPENIQEYFRLSPVEKNFIKEYINYQLKKNPWNKKMELLKNRLEWLDKWVIVFLRYLAKNFAKDIKWLVEDNLNNLQLSEKAKNELVGNSDKKGILDDILEKVFSENPNEILEKANKSWLWLFEYMRKTFYSQIVEKVLKDNNLNQDEKRNIIEFFYKNKDDFFKKFWQTVLNIEQVKYATELFLNDSKFLGLLEKIKNQVKSKIKIEKGSYETYVLAALAILSETNENVDEKQLRKKVEEFVKIKGKEEILNSDILLNVIRTIKSDNNFKYYINQFREHNKNKSSQLKSMIDKAKKEMDDFMYENLKKYDNDLAEWFWDEHLDSFSKENKIEQQIGIPKETFENQISSYVKETKWEKPVWTYPEYKDWSYVVKLYLPKPDKKDSNKDEEAIVIEASSIVDLNKKLLKKWAEYQWLNWIDLIISSPDMFKDKFWKDINKLFTPSDIEDISKVMARYLIEKIDGDSDIKDYIYTHYEDLYKKLVFNPLKWLSDFIKNLRLNDEFKKKIGKILPKGFVLKNQFDIKDFSDNLHIGLNDFFEEKKDKFSLWLFSRLWKRLLNKLSLK